MTICIFAGPTLPPAEAAKILEADYLPPAAIGDVYKAAQKRPWAIGIIDGFFESTPSVWHKEVLWAMAQGIHVFGASSMGALRAAELAAFGMIGVGAIFEAYRDGAIEDDDEVAVVHGPPELGYVQLSEAMVNIRATMKKAIAADVAPPATAAALIEIAKSLYYKQRSYDRLLSEASGHGLPADEVARFKAWLPKIRSIRSASMRSPCYRRSCWRTLPPWHPSRPHTSSSTRSCGMPSNVNMAPAESKILPSSPRPRAMASSMSCASTPRSTSGFGATRPCAHSRGAWPTMPAWSQPCPSFKTPRAAFASAWGSSRRRSLNPGCAIAISATSSSCA
jgi:hypothetical protein